MACHSMNRKCFLSRRDAFCGLAACSLVAMTTAGHKVANNVIKFLLWRDSDENGDVAQGCTGVVIHEDKQGIGY